MLNQLWRHTPAQSSFPANMLAIRGGRPETLTLRDIIESFVKFREEVITRRSKFELLKARERAHILLGLVVAVTNLDEVVKLIRGSASPGAKRARSCSPANGRAPRFAPTSRSSKRSNRRASRTTYQLSEAQVKAILELRLHRLTALGRDEIGNELKELAESIGELLEILANRARLYEVMREEFDEVEAEFATPRMSELAPAAEGIEDEDLIEVEDMVVTVTMTGYIKRTPLAVFREQKRGGKGRAGMATKDEDAVTNLFVTSTHNPVLFFSNLGRVYRMKVWRLPEGGPNTKGRPMINLLPLAEGETISTVLPLPEDENEWGGLHIMFATAHGTVRRNSMAAFTNIPTAGKIAMRFGASAVEDVGERRRQRGADGSDRPADRRRTADRGRRRPPRHPQRQGDPLQVDRRARIPVANLDGRPRRPPARRRRGHLHVDPAPRRHDTGGARRLSEIAGMARRLLPRGPERRALGRDRGARSSSS